LRKKDTKRGTLEGASLVVKRQRCFVSGWGEMILKVGQRGEKRREFSMKKEKGPGKRNGESPKKKALREIATKTQRGTRGGGGDRLLRSRRRIWRTSRGTNQQRPGWCQKGKNEYPETKK